MVALIILALYAVIALSYLFLSFFIVYHLANYAINSEFKIVMLLVFIVVAGGLFLANITFFFATDWNSLLLKFSA